MSFGFTGPLSVGLPYMADNTLGGGSATFGILLSAFGAGALVGAVVAGSIATAVALTLGGLVLVASWTTPRPADQRPSAHSTSVVWQRPAVGNPPAPIEIATNRAAKTAPLLVPAIVAAPDAAAPAPAARRRSA